MKENIYEVTLGNVSYSYSRGSYYAELYIDIDGKLFSIMYFNPAKTYDKLEFVKKLQSHIINGGSLRLKREIKKHIKNIIKEQIIHDSYEGKSDETEKILENLKNHKINIKL